MGLLGIEDGGEWTCVSGLSPPVANWTRQRERLEQDWRRLWSPGADAVSCGSWAGVLTATMRGDEFDCDSQVIVVIVHQV
jgi:hypothetical protein